MVTQIGEASVVLSNWGASKVSELIKNKAVLAGWTVYDSGGAGADTTDMTTGAKWWVIKHPTDNFYIFLRDLYESLYGGTYNFTYRVNIAWGNDWNATTNAWVTGTGKYNRLNYADYYGTSNSNGYTVWLEYAFSADQLAFYLFTDQSTIYWKRHFVVIGKLLAYDSLLYSGSYVTPYFFLEVDDNAGYTLDGISIAWMKKPFGYVDENSTWYLDEVIFYITDPTSTIPTFSGAKLIGKVDPDLVLLASYQDSNSSLGSDMQTVTVTASGYKYLLARMHRLNRTYNETYYATSFGTTYGHFGLRTNL